MLQKALKFFDSFKKNQTSALLRTQRAKIMALINGPYFSTKIKPYFATMHAEGIPFTDYAEEPKQITLFKDAINALYHAELAFLDLENVDFRDGYSPMAIWKAVTEIYHLYTYTFHQGYQASYLLTHLDIHLSELFATEIKTLLPLLTKAQGFIDAHANDAALMTQQLQHYPIGYQAGLYSGIAVDQMRPDRDIDYSFLTQFSTVLPGYIQKITSYIQKYSPDQLNNFKQTLDKAQLDELEKKGTSLLKSLANLQGESFFVSAKLFYFANIIRQVISLSMSIKLQMENLNDSSQDVIRDNLGELKAQLFSLLRLADRLEDEFLLTPGTISNPLIRQVKPLYELLINYTSNVVNFSQKGKELTSLEDPQFINLRLAETEQRIVQAKCNLIKIEQAGADFELFFRILEKPRYADKLLISLPEQTKKALINHYKSLEPYVKQIDAQLNNNVIKALTQKNLWGISNSFNPWHWIVPSAHEKFKVSSLLKLKEKIKVALVRDTNTQVFHIELNEDIVSSVYEKADVHLYPYKRNTNLLSVDEALIIKVDPTAENNFGFAVAGTNRFITARERLTVEQSLDLYVDYEDKLAKIGIARKTYTQFMAIIRANHPNALQTLESQTRAELRRLYCCFQPYLVDILADEPDRSNYDDLIIANLSDLPSPPLFTEHLINVEQMILEQLQNRELLFQQKSADYRNHAGRKYRIATHAQNLIVEEASENRADFLLKHRDYSQIMGEFKASISQLANFCNKAMQEQLQPARSGVPFPELEDRIKVLTQSKQALGIKYILNSVYHLEQIIKHLETLNNNSFETVYVGHLVLAHKHLDNIISAAKELQNDPYLSLIATDLADRAKAIYQTLIIHSEPYRASPEGIALPGAPQAASSANPGTTPAVEVKYGEIWYPLNAFMLVPAQICAAAAKTALTEEETRAIQAHTKKVALDIKGIIDSSNSYFKLLLKTPVMLKLFFELKERLSQFSSLSYGAVLEHLEEINTEFFTKILLETDLWEDRLGLKPGQISEPMKHMLDEFYKGLVEPLGFVSQKHIDLINTVVPINKRQEAVAARKRQAIAEQNTLKENYKIMKDLLGLLESYRYPFFREDVEQDLIETYKKALPILKERESLFGLLNKADIKKSPDLDRFIKEAVDNLPQPFDGADLPLDLTDIEAHCKLVYNYYLGLVNTHELEIQTAAEKEQYLVILLEKQRVIQENFVVDYTKKVIKRQVGAALNNHTGLLLNENIGLWSNQMIEAAKTSEDIDKTVRELIAEQIAHFDQDNYRKYVHLDAVWSALDQFKIYLATAEIDLKNNKSRFETTATLEAKTRLINELETIALDRSKTVGARLEEIKSKNIESILLACSHPEPFTLAWLTRIVISFLKLLHIYTPPHIKKYQQLDEAIHTPPKTRALNRYRLFEAPPQQRHYALPQQANISASHSPPVEELPQAEFVAPAI